MIFLISIQMNGQKCSELVHNAFQTVMMAKNLFDLNQTRIQWTFIWQIYHTRHITLSNPFTQPHQIYSDVVQRQDKTRQDKAWNNQGKQMWRHMNSWVQQLKHIKVKCVQFINQTTFKAIVRNQQTLGEWNYKYTKDYTKWFTVAITNHKWRNGNQKSKDKSQADKATH